MGEEGRREGKEGIQRLPPHLGLGQPWSTGQDGGCKWELSAAREVRAPCECAGRLGDGSSRVWHGPLRVLPHVDSSEVPERPVPSGDCLAGH